jgi:thiamine biosynthesis lipoprotein
MTAGVTSIRLPQLQVIECMGTVFTIDVRAPGVDASAVTAATDWLRWVDATFSTYLPQSQISLLNKGDLTLDQCALEVGEVLQRCDELSEETGGYFSARYGPELDPSGYVKGWAIERASDLLSSAGSRRHCVNGGGDVQCVGQPAADRHWRVGIAHPQEPDKVIAAVEGDDLAVATSGITERGNHVIDPHTGEPPDGVVTLTVIGSRLADVDAYATAAFAMGNGARGWLNTMPDIRSFAFCSDGTSWSTGRP